MDKQIIKLAFNISPLSSGHSGRGMGSYTRNLLNELKQISLLQIQEFRDLNEVKDADLVHYPFFDLFQRSLKINRRFPTVVTIPDVIPLIFPKKYPPGLRGRFNLNVQKYLLKKIEAVITLSENSKKDVSKFLKVPLGNIYPIYLASSEHFRVMTEIQTEATKKKYNLPEKFILFAGNRNWNKNLLNATEACINLNLDIIFIGKDFGDKANLDHPELKVYKEFLAKYEKNPLVHILGYIPDEELVALYNLASITLLVSFYEGFGLPILESQACGTPVITSNVSSIPEVSGNSTFMVNPESRQEIEQAIKLLIEDKRMKERLVREGFENIKRFSWKKTAEETIRVYEQVLHLTNEKLS